MMENNQAATTYSLYTEAGSRLNRLNRSEWSDWEVMLVALAKLHGNDVRAGDDQTIVDGDTNEVIAEYGVGGQMTCPRCHAELTPAQIRSLSAKLTSSLVRKRSGGKVWRKHRAGYSRCRCAKCNAGRKR